MGRHMVRAYAEKGYKLTRCPWVLTLASTTTSFNFYLHQLQLLLQIILIQADSSLDITRKHFINPPQITRWHQKSSLSLPPTTSLPMGHLRAGGWYVSLYISTPLVPLLQISDKSNTPTSLSSPTPTPFSPRTPKSPLPLPKAASPP